MIEYEYHVRADGVTTGFLSPDLAALDAAVAIADGSERVRLETLRAQDGRVLDAADVPVNPRLAKMAAEVLKKVAGLRGALLAAAAAKARAG